MGDVALPADDLVLEKMLRSSKFGPPMPYESTPWDFAHSWGDAVLRTRVWPIVSRLFVDEDEMVRARCAELARVWNDSSDVTLPRLIEVAEKHGDLYADQRPEGCTLRSELAFALCNRSNPELGPRVAKVLEEMVLHEALGGGAAIVIARNDPGFVAAHAKVWGDARQSWFAEAASAVALYRRDELLGFLHELRVLGAEARAEVLARAESYLEPDDTKATAIATSQKLPPPTKPAPTADECRRALAL